MTPELPGGTPESIRPGATGDHTTVIGGEPIGIVGLVYRGAGESQHIVVNHRPRSSLLLLSRLMGEKLAGPPYAKYFLTGS